MDHPRDILLIVVDDLRPQLASYGSTFMHTPNMDQLVSEGVLFERAYAQIAICSPSRNSFLSGRYPSSTGVFNFIDDFRNGTATGSEMVALPEFFRLGGYHTMGAGKVYHANHPPNFDGNRSWSEPWPGDYGNCNCIHPSASSASARHWPPPNGQATCEGLRPSSCGDDTIVATVVAQLGSVVATRARGAARVPFFVAAGLHKPHLPFYAPQADFALYRGVAPAASNPMTPSDMPYVAWHSCLSDNAANYSNWGRFGDIANNMTLSTPMDAAATARLRRGYYASVTYTDRNVGKILAAAEPMRNTTIVALIADHGFHLGEQNLWCKMTNFENSVRVPLILRAPGVQAAAGMRISQLAEAVDLYKTLAELSGVGLESVDPSVDGVSLAPLVMQPHAKPMRTVAQSQYPRCFSAINATPSPLPTLDRTDCQDVPRAEFDLMGFSIRTASFRLTEWRVWDRASLRGRWDVAPTAIELYRHADDDKLTDPFSTETANVAADPLLAPTLKDLQDLLRDTFHDARRGQRTHR